MNQQRWILAVAQTSKLSYAHKINELIRPYIETKFVQEINSNVENALSSKEPAVSFIIKSFVSETPSVQYRIKYIDFYSVKAQEILNSCFIVSGYKRDLSLRFKDYYKAAFEHLMSKSVKVSIEIEVIDESGTKNTHSQVF